MGFWRPIAVLAALVGVVGCSDAPEPVALAAESVGPPVAHAAPAPQIDYPDLSRGRYYTVSARTALQSALPSATGEGPRVEHLPAQGIFQVIDRRAVGAGLWYRVLVSNGIEDYAMYLDAAALNGQDVTLVARPESPPVVEETPAPARNVSMPRVRLF